MSLSGTATHDSHRHSPFLVRCRFSHCNRTSPLESLKGSATVLDIISVYQIKGQCVPYLLFRPTEYPDPGWVASARRSGLTCQVRLSSRERSDLALKVGIRGAQSCIAVM